MDYQVNDFETDVLERSHTLPVVVDFWADWCGPCRVLGPVLEKLAGGNDGRWALAKLDTERFRSIAAQYGIRSIPNVKLFVDGEVRDEFVGALPEDRVAAWLGAAIPSRRQADLETARRLLGENRSLDAQALLEDVAALEGGNEEAVVLLAWSYLGSDPQRAEEGVRAIKAGSKSYEQAEAITILAALFRRAAGAEGLPADTVRDAYALAAAEARSGAYEQALAGFIEVIRRRRSYDDDGSRKACIAIFKLLGDDHRVTKAHRPALSNALF